MSRTPAKIVVEGLQTKSDKIRFLARAGYSRAEIAKFLGIRYQHVRNVLVQSGIEAGSRNDLPKTNQPSSRIEREIWSTEKLIDSGFELLGACRIVENGNFEYERLAPNLPGVYAFAVDNVITYIGLTRSGLRTRLGHYVYGHVNQKTSHRVKGLILNALQTGKHVCTLVATPPDFEWNGLPVDGPAGLETALIKLVRPDWNKQGTVG